MQSSDKGRRQSLTHLKRLLQLARHERGKLAVGVLFLGIGSGTSLLFPQAIQMIIDDALGPGKGVEAINKAALFDVHTGAGGLSPLTGRGLHARPAALHLGAGLRWQR